MVCVSLLSRLSRPAPLSRFFGVCFVTVYLLCTVPDIETIWATFLGNYYLAGLCALAILYGLVVRSDPGCVRAVPCGLMSPFVSFCLVHVPIVANVVASAQHLLAPYLHLSVVPVYLRV